MNWDECVTKRWAKKAEVDEELVKSLLITLKNKATSASLLEISDVTASSVVSLYYDSLRELLEVLAIQNGFKIYNHECYTGFLKEVLKKEEFADRYDRVRKIRNSVNYYGKSLSAEEAREIAEDIKLLSKELQLFVKQ